MTSTNRLEFWPDYSGVLVHAAGKPVPLADLPLPSDLVARATVWVSGYADPKLPFGNDPDPAWFEEGQAIFDALRTSLAAAGIELEDWEGIWSPGTV